MKKLYIKPTTEIIKGLGEQLMVQISGTTTPEETEAKRHPGMGFDDSEPQAQAHSINAWETWEED